MKLPRSKFESAARRRLNSGTPAEAIFGMMSEYEITEQEIDTFLKFNAIKSAVNGALTQSKEQKEIIYNLLDKKFIEKHINLVVFMRGENISFYEYRKGVYVYLNDIDMENLVDDIMDELSLLDYRTKRKYVKDTVARIGSLLCRTTGKFFNDDTLVNNKWYLNLTNGLLDPLTHILSPHTPSYFSTVQIPFDYDSKAICPEFDLFIKNVSGDREHIAQMIQEMYGYGLTDGNRRHKVFYLYGDTARNGKSTTAKILCGLIGMGNVSTLSLEQIAGENSSILTSIVNKQINFSDELSSKFIDSSRLTAMSSESLIEINPKYKHSFTYKVKAKFIISCNDLPRFNDSQGMKHRMISIPFSVHIKEDKRILDYDQILLKKEGSGILNWAIEGTKKLKENGVFFISDESKEDMHENSNSSNSVYAFLESNYVFSEEYSEFIHPDTIYGDVGTRDGGMTMYRLFCHRTGIKAMALQNFKKEILRFCNETQKIQRKRNKNDERCYIGLQEKDYENKSF